jgi:hypothetical protein
VQGTTGSQGTTGAQGTQGITGPVAGSANQVVYKNGSNVATGSSSLTYDGTDLAISSGKIAVNTRGGDEGGEIFLANAVTNTTVTGGVTIDVYQNKLRFFEQGGTARGFYLDITTGIAGVGSAIGAGGAQGTTGAQGTQGVQGTTGVGTQGATGLQGATGSQGTSGTNGSDGAQGATGLQGIQGTQGITGIQGATGLTGTTVNGVSISNGGTFKVPGAHYYTSNTGGTQSTSWVISLQGTTPPAQNPDGSAFEVGDIWISWT